MAMFSTCPTCGLLVEIVDDYRTHPNCDEPTDPEAELVDLYLDALLRDDEATAAQLGKALDRVPPLPRLREAALLYASWGWPVFPLQPNSKTPATRNGFKDASTDPDKINTWWAKMPHANIGLPTGHAFDVVDVDAPAGWRAHGELVASGTLPDVHGIASTAGSGLHLYVKPTGGGNLAGIRPGIDYRGKSGYVVAPPSVDKRGFPYVWRIKPSPVLTNSTREEAAA